MLAGASFPLPSFRALQFARRIDYNSERERRGYKDQQQQRGRLA